MLVLKICLAVIVVGLAILAVDRFLVRPHEPTEAEGLAAAAAELDMSLHREYAEAATLLALTGGLDGLVPPAERIGAALVRDADDHQLIVYEHRYDARALLTRTQTHDAEVELLGILIRLPGADLPRFGLRPDGRVSTDDEAGVRAVLTAEAVGRMASFRDFVLAAEGEHVLFVSRPPASALVAASQRSTSPEFLPGLRNSGLKIDVQRAIDVTNRLALGREPLAPVYRIDTSDIQVEVEMPELDLGLDEAFAEGREAIDESVREAHRSFDEITEKHRRDSEARQAEFQRKMQEVRERMAESRSRLRTDVAAAGDVLTESSAAGEAATEAAAASEAATEGAEEADAPAAAEEADLSGGGS